MSGDSVAAIVSALVFLLHVGDPVDLSFVHLNGLVGHGSGLAPPPEELALGHLQPAEQVDAGPGTGREPVAARVAVVALCKIRGKKRIVRKLNYSKAFCLHGPGHKTTVDIYVSLASIETLQHALHYYA